MGFTEVMERIFNEDTRRDSVKRGRMLIDSLFSRRNEIVHQNDRSHATALQNDIDREYVEDFLGNIEKVTYTIHDIATMKDNEIRANVKE